MNDTAHAAAAQHAATPIPATAKVATPVPPAKATPAVTLGSGIVDVLATLRGSIEPEALAIYHKVAPWYVQAVIGDKVIDDAITYGIAMAEGAVKGAVLSLPTVQTVLEEAVRFVDTHIPSFLRPFFGPVEDIIIVDLQKLGALPPAFGRAATSKAV